VAGRGIEATLVLLAKWVVVIILFFGLVMPAQIIFFIFFPLIKKFREKQNEKTGIAVALNIWFPIEWYAGYARKFIEGTFL
jgi:hypothetical protein